MKIGIIIPARLNSKRLPKKVLRKFGGKSMIEHVWIRAKIASPTSEIYITTDDKKIAGECKAFGANIIMSSSHHSNGLSRVGEVSRKLKWDYFIILQADELLLLPENIKKLVNEIQLKKYYDVYCLISTVNIKDLTDKNIVKCVTGRDQNIITFFRKNWFTSHSKKNLQITKKVCGVYAISKQTMLSITTGKTQILERNESIEQFRFLELGKRIKGVIVTKNYISINTFQDMSKAKKIIKTDLIQKKILKTYNHTF